MAMSYYSNWDTFQNELMEETKLPPELYNDCFALPPDDDSYFNIAQFLELEPEPEPNYFFASPQNNYINNPLPPPPNNNNYNINNQFHFEAAPAADYNSLKRQRVDYEQQQQQLVMYSDEQLLMAGLTNCNQQLEIDDQMISGFLLPDHQFTMPGFGNVNKAPPAPPAISLSAQSIAARQRRRKISEKTQELGKLIPGANKLNTAEMFQAAYKYIQFMQAQVGILEFIGSNHHQEEEKGDELIESEETMHGLLMSTLVQEKLYSTEKCIVPKKFVQEMDINC